MVAAISNSLTDLWYLSNSLRHRVSTRKTPHKEKLRQAYCKLFRYVGIDPCQRPPERPASLLVRAHVPIEAARVLPSNIMGSAPPPSAVRVHRTLLAPVVASTIMLSRSGTSLSLLPLALVSLSGFEMNFPYANSLFNLDWNCSGIFYRAGLQNNMEANVTLRVRAGCRDKEKLSDILHKSQFPTQPHKDNDGRHLDGKIKARA